MGTYTAVPTHQPRTLIYPPPRVMEKGGSSVSVLGIKIYTVSKATAKAAKAGHLNKELENDRRVEARRAENVR